MNNLTNDNEYKNLIVDVALYADKKIVTIKSVVKKKSEEIK